MFKTSGSVIKNYIRYNCILKNCLTKPVGETVILLTYLNSECENT